MGWWLSLQGGRQVPCLAQCHVKGSKFTNPELSPGSWILPLSCPAAMPPRHLFFLPSYVARLW